MFTIRSICSQMKITGSYAMTCGRYILVIVSIFSLYGCTLLPRSDNPAILTIAVIGPFSGDISLLGQSLRNGIVLATEEQNARGGVLGRRVQLKLFDSACDFETARNVALEAIRDEGAYAILGAVCGDASEGVAQIASNEGVLLINPASVNADLTLDPYGDLRPYVYSVPFIDSAQGVVLAHLALDRLEAKTASILVARNSPYESTLADAFSETFTENGGEILLRESYDRMEETYYDALTELRDAKADIIYLPGYYDVVNKLAAQARVYGVNQLILGSDGWHSAALDPTYIEGCYFTSHYCECAPSHEIREWVDAYEARFLVKPDTIATLSYDATNILFTAIEHAGTVDSFVLAQSMETMTFNTLLGELTFDESHHPVKPVIILQIRDGAVVYDSSVLTSDIKE